MIPQSISSTCDIKQKKKGKKKMSKSICMEIQQYENEIRMVANLAKEERRSLAQMTAILIMEAIRARDESRQKNNKQLLKKEKTK